MFMLKPDLKSKPVENTAAGYYYGTGVKNKIGRMRSDSIGFRPVAPKSLKKPPRGLA